VNLKENIIDLKSELNGKPIGYQKFFTDEFGIKQGISESKFFVLKMHSFLLYKNGICQNVGYFYNLENDQELLELITYKNNNRSGIHIEFKY